jgi:hypothetical protein
VESADPPLLVFAFWPLLSQWLGQNWPWLCLLGAVSLAFIFRDWLLEQSAGRFWIVPAALLPASITFARDWDQQAPAPLKGCIVPILLLAVAVLQLYGQERNERYRKTADDAVKQQGIVLRGLADTVKQQGDTVKQQGIVLRGLADTVEQQGAGIDRIGAGVEKQGAELSSIANAISDIASEAQSAATYP